MTPVLLSSMVKKLVNAHRPSSAKVFFSNSQSIDKDNGSPEAGSNHRERRLDNKMREGGWGAVSAAVAVQTNSKWTARTLRSLDGEF